MHSYVLDVNIWISLFIKKEYSEKFVEWKVATNNLIYCSDVMTNELWNVINREHIAKLLKKTTSECYGIYNEITTLFNPIPIFTGCQDHKDNYLFDLAIQAQADFLVTGDKTVLTTKINPPPQIISFNEFREMFL